MKEWLQRATLLTFKPQGEGFELICEENRLFVPYYEASFLKEWFWDSKRLIIFEHAKPSLQILMGWDLYIKNPVCLKTLKQLLKPYEPEIENKSFVELMSGVEKHNLGSLCHLECQVINPFVWMQQRGLLVDAKALKTHASQSAQCLALHKAMHPVTHRIHACFEPMGASTGRSTCHDPNIQNWPKEFRHWVIAPAGFKLVGGDYAACELRVLGALANEPVFLEAFEQDLDLHEQVQKRLNLPDRAMAKVLNFGMVYGMGPKTLSQHLSCSEYEAEGFLQSYFKAFPKLHQYLKLQEEKALELGYVETLLGRRLLMEDTALEGAKRRLGRNMPIQGAAAEIMKLAMVMLFEKAFEKGSPEFYMVNMLHDEVVLEVKEGTDFRFLETLLEAAMRQLIPACKPKCSLWEGKFWK